MKVLTLAREDLRMTLRDRSSIFWIFIAPFLWVFFFGAMSRVSDPAKTRIGLLVVQEDPSPLAARLVEHLRAENFDVKVVGPGEPRPQGDDAPGRSLRIPAGFGEAVAARRKVELELREERKVSAEGTFATQIALHRATVRLLGGIAFGDFDPAQDAVRVRASWATGRKVPGGLYQSIPGNLVMFVLIATMSYGAALLANERKRGTLRRLATSPLSRAELITGKALGRAGIAVVQVTVFLLIGLTVFRIDWGSSPLGLATLLAAYVACAAALSLLSGTLFASPGAAAGAGVASSLVMSAMGGCWWPSEVMPDWMRLAGHAFPTAWAMDGLHAVISWGGGLADVLLPSGVLALYAVVAGTLATFRLRTTG